MKRTGRLSRARPAHARAAVDATEAVLDIREIGGRGDGVAEGVEGPIYTPFALPGERVRARLLGDRGELLARETESPDRVAPPCPHYGRCGGCQLQHWAEAPYLAWKREEVVRALARRGVEAEVAPIIPAWGEGRRRAAFHAARTQGALSFGFIERGGARIARIEECPVLAPGLAAALPALKEIARLFAPERGEITLTCILTATGLDCDVKGARDPDRGLRERAATAAASFARLSLDGEMLAMQRTPRLAMGAAMLEPPPATFLQATAAGEAALATLALDALAGAKRIADLFCGVGTFALRLAEFAAVDAFDSEASMLAALKRAADGVPAGLKPITVTRRDLLRTPLSALELKRYDAIVFDPPRSGARLQAGEIAKSRAERVSAISCDAGAFARDARALIDGGFKLLSVTPVDQFRWSPHVEIAGAFAR